MARVPVSLTVGGTAVMLSVVLIACGSGGGGPSDYSTGPTTPSRVRSLPELQLLMDGPVDTQVGQGVIFRITLKNLTGGPFGIELAGDYPAEFTVETNDGTPVWWLTYGKVIRGFAVFRTLAADEELSFDAFWNLADNGGKPLPPGNYYARGTLNVGYPFKMEARQPVTITP
jgi:hypothetical protein